MRLCNPLPSPRVCLGLSGYLSVGGLGSPPSFASDAQRCLGDTFRVVCICVSLSAHRGLSSCRRVPPPPPAPGLKARLGHRRPEAPQAALPTGRARSLRENPTVSLSHIPGRGDGGPDSSEPLAGLVGTFGDVLAAELSPHTPALGAPAEGPLRGGRGPAGSVGALQGPRGHHSVVTLGTDHPVRQGGRKSVLP